MRGLKVKMPVMSLLWDLIVLIRRLIKGKMNSGFNPGGSPVTKVVCMSGVQILAPATPHLIPKVVLPPTLTSKKKLRGRWWVSLTE